MSGYISRNWICAAEAYHQYSQPQIHTKRSHIATYVLVRQGVHKLRLAARKFGLTLEHLDRLRDFVLLQVELREGRDRGFALGVDE